MTGKNGHKLFKNAMKRRERKYKSPKKANIILSPQSLSSSIQLVNPSGPFTWSIHHRYALYQYVFLWTHPPWFFLIHPFRTSS